MVAKGNMDLAFQYIIENGLCSNRKSYTAEDERLKMI